jgi:hypothetical protein
VPVVSSLMIFSSLVTGLKSTRARVSRIIHRTELRASSASQAPSVHVRQVCSGPLSSAPTRPSASSSSLFLDEVVLPTPGGNSNSNVIPETPENRLATQCELLPTFVVVFRGPRGSTVILFHGLTVICRTCLASRPNGVDGAHLVTLFARDGIMPDALYQMTTPPT